MHLTDIFVDWRLLPRFPRNLAQIENNAPALPDCRGPANLALSCMNVQFLRLRL